MILTAKETVVEMKTGMKTTEGIAAETDTPAVLQVMEQRNRGSCYPTMQSTPALVIQNKNSCVAKLHTL